MKRFALSAIVGALISAMGATIYAQDAQLVTVEAYEELNDDEQFEALRASLAVVYDHYTNKQPDQEIANCILRLFNDPNTSPNGYDYFLTGVSVVSSGQSAHELTIQQVLLGVINRQCGV